MRDINDEGARRLAAVIVAGIVREYKADYFEILADTDGASLIKAIREMVNKDATRYPSMR